jgi:hypothetical protein
MERDESGRWFAFNREYKPLGFNLYDRVKYENYPIQADYPELTEELIQHVAKGCTIERNERQEITKFYLYNDATNPMRTGKWSAYWKNLERLCKLRSRDPRFAREEEYIF